MKIYLLRHGETEYNAQKRYLGRTDIPLSASGAEALVCAGVALEKVYVTPLRRTAQTAEILFPGVRQIPVPDLREMDFGIFEGLNYMDLADSAAYREWVEGNCLGPVPQGESKELFCQRVCAAFASLVDRSLRGGERQLAIVAHGGTQMAVMERYGLPRKGYFDWLGPCGGGFVLDASRWREENVLTVAETVRYTKRQSLKNGC